LVRKTTPKEKTRGEESIRDEAMRPRNEKKEFANAYGTMERSELSREASQKWESREGGKSYTKRRNEPLKKTSVASKKLRSTRGREQTEKGNMDVRGRYLEPWLTRGEVAISRENT